MAVDGWIKLHRKLLENPFWLDKPFSKGQAWIDLLLLVNHEPNEIMIGNEVVQISTGQRHTSELKLAQRWGWSRKKVRAYLNLLENQKMATTKATTKGTTITIEKYVLYQTTGTTEGTTEGTSKEHQKNNEGYTNKNEKNDKNKIYGDFFEQIWKLYPVKKGKASVSNTQKEKLYAIGLEEMTRAIERYKKDQQGAELKFWKHGSSFFNKGYVDYLDANYDNQKPLSTVQEVIVEW